MLLFTPLSLLLYSRDSGVFLIFGGVALLAFLLLGAATVKNKITRSTYLARMKAIKADASFNVLQLVKEYREFVSVTESNFTPRTLQRLREAAERHIADVQNGPLKLLDIAPVNNEILLLLLGGKHDKPYIPNGGETFSVTHTYYHFCTLQLKPDKNKLALRMEPAFYDGDYPTEYALRMEALAETLLKDLQNDANNRPGVSP